MEKITNSISATAKVLVLLVLNLSFSDTYAAFAQKRAVGRDRPRQTTQRRPVNQARPNQTNVQRNRNTNSGNRVNNKSNNNINSGNKTVNINVNNSHNTVVRQNNVRAYTRPPYVYGGRSYYSFHPYYYHPYHPFAWGPVYHPWGFFIATLAATAIVVTVANQQYHYDQGVYYAPSNGGYTVVQAPVGAVVTTIPSNAQTVVVNQTTNNYYYAGTFYEKSSKGYTVVPPTAGTVVESLPEGGKETKIGDITYVKFGETYYQPIQQNGKNVYEVVQVTEAK